MAFLGQLLSHLTPENVRLKVADAAGNVIIKDLETVYFANQFYVALEIFLAKKRGVGVKKGCAP